MITRKFFRGELKKLHSLFFEMNQAVYYNLNDMNNAIKNDDIKLAKNVIANDDIVDELEVKIEKFCIEILVRQQPVAGDLREIMAILKMISDLERIADYCSYVCEHYINLQSIDLDECNNQLLILSNNALSMFKGLSNSYLELNDSFLNEIIKKDSVSDKAFENLKSLIDSNFKNVNSKQAIDLILIGKALERLADHITNVCDWIFYKSTGKIKD